MDKLLADIGVVRPGATYLDVASCYGWFVAEMTRLGFTATGVERDPLARELGPAIYGTLGPQQILTADAVEFLRDDPGPWDVVSCFSLLHHFVLGRGSVDEVELLRLLDRATGRVLFIDTGQGHEDWFRKSLSSWDADYVRRVPGAARHVRPGDRPRSRPGRCAALRGQLRTAPVRLRQERLSQLLRVSSTCSPRGAMSDPRGPSARGR